MALIRCNGGAKAISVKSYGNVAANATQTFSKGSIVVISGAAIGTFGSDEATLLQRITGARDDTNVYSIDVDNATYTNSTVVVNYVEISA